MAVALDVEEPGLLTAPVLEIAGVFTGEAVVLAVGLVVFGTTPTTLAAVVDSVFFPEELASREVAIGTRDTGEITLPGDAGVWFSGITTFSGDTAVDGEAGVSSTPEAAGTATAPVSLAVTEPLFDTIPVALTTVPLSTAESCADTEDLSPTFFTELISSDPEDAPFTDETHSSAFFAADEPIDCSSFSWAAAVPLAPSQDRETAALHPFTAPTPAVAAGRLERSLAAGAIRVTGGPVTLTAAQVTDETDSASAAGLRVAPPRAAALVAGRSSFL